MIMHKKVKIFHFSFFLCVGLCLFAAYDFLQMVSGEDNFD